jgi:predicted MFS family arabinose efflux permease
MPTLPSREPASAAIPPSTGGSPPAAIPAVGAGTVRPSGWRKTFSTLRHRNFRFFVTGQLISLAGTWMQIVAQGWLVYQISRSEATLGVVAFASAIPSLAVSPWAGVIIDRMQKRNLLIATQIASMLMAFLLAALTFTETVQVWHVVVIAAVLGAVNAVDGPARQAFVVEMVGREDLPNAIALNSMTFNTARVIGPAFGGLLLATVGAAWCFTVNGFSFLAVIFGLIAMRLAPTELRSTAQSPWEELKSGIRYATGHAEISGLLLLALVLSVFGITYSTVLPAYVDRVLALDASAFGWMTAATGIGALVGVAGITGLSERVARGQILFTAAILFPVVLAGVSVVTWFPLVILLAGLSGMGFMTQFVLINTLLQTRVDNSVRGRVMSLYTLTFQGFAPFGNLAIGAVSEARGIPAAILLAAGATLLGTILVYLRTPQLRHLP